MALFLFQFCLVFAIGSFVPNGLTSLSVAAFVNSPSPDRFWLSDSPPAQVVITATKNSPVYLPCHAVADIDINDRSDSDIDPNLELDWDTDYENNANEEVDILQPPQVERQAFNGDASELHNIAHDTTNTGDNNSDLDEDGDYEEDDNHQRSVGRSQRSPYDGLVEYVWYRNGLEFFSTAFQNQNYKQTHKGFRLFPNGTLKIPYNRQMSNISAGVYRCKANLTRHAVGTILSTESVVTIGYLERYSFLINENNTVTVPVQTSFILHCPFVSHPPANITWMINKTQIMFNNYGSYLHENRYYQLHNGSLLLTDVRQTDSGRYRCNASNNYAAKNFRSYSQTVFVQPIVQKASDRLLPPMQSQVQHIHTGSTFKLYCAGESARPKWIFTPRHSGIPINLVNFTYQLRFSNVSADKHEGIYNCSVGSNFHFFNVTVLVPPVFLNNLTSYTSSVVASMSFNCSVSGNPKPKITWFKNGREITNNYIVHYNYPILRINTIDPEDEGLYQCIAKNEAGEASISMYLSIRDKDRYKRISKKPESIQCFPIDTTSIYIRFDRGLQHVNTEYVMYYLASDNPYSWYSSPPTQLLTNNSLKITGSMITPFRNYTVYLRACSVINVPDAGNAGPTGKEQVIPSKLSKGIQCTSQGVPVLSIFFPTGIFIWWPRFLNIEPTALTIQFKHTSDADTLPISMHQINGTLRILDDYITYEEVVPLLTTINITSTHFWENVPEDGSIIKRRRKRRRRAFDVSKNPKQIFESLTGTQLDFEVSGGNTGVSEQNKHYIKLRQISITQIKVPGNVTGVLIPNTKKINVRILGSLATDGEPLPQDYRYIQWKTIDSSQRLPDAVNRFQTDHLDARSVQFTWSRFIANDLINQCLVLCYKNVNHDVVIRGGSSRLNCLNVPQDAMHFNLAGLLPFTLYKAFLKPCYSKEPISDVLDFQTKQDAPGPVTNHMLVRKDGIMITWGPPENRNGILQGYFITWTDKDSVRKSVNLTIDTNRFQFPNVSTDDKINISIQAIGSTGIGIPIFLNLLNHVDVPYEREPEARIPWMEILFGTIIIVGTIMFCGLLFIHKRNCKKRRRNQAAAATTVTLHQSANCNTDIHEMQTLIRTPEQLPVLIPNGKFKQQQFQKTAPSHLQITDTLENVRNNTTTSCAGKRSTSDNGMLHNLSSNRNILLTHTTTSSPNSDLLPVKQPTVSSHVLNNNLRIPLNTLSVVNSKNNHVSSMETAQQIPIAISSNNINHSSNSIYLRKVEHCEQPRAASQPMQQKHSFKTTFTSDHVPSSAATSASLSSASNCSATSAGSSGLTCPASLQQKQKHNYCLVASDLASQNKTPDLPTCLSPVPEVAVPEVRITENPQHLKKNNKMDDYHPPSAVLNTSFFDSSQRRLLNLTIDSNSIEQHDDEGDVTNCDLDSDINHHSAVNHPSRLTTLAEDDNNNEQERIQQSEHECEDRIPYNGSNVVHTGCRQFSPGLPIFRDSTSRRLIGLDHDSVNIDEYKVVNGETNLEELDNSSLLNDGGLSSKPLHQQHTSNWNFRRPIIGPNG